MATQRVSAASRAEPVARLSSPPRTEPESRVAVAGARDGPSRDGARLGRASVNVSMKVWMPGHQYVSNYIAMSRCGITISTCISSM